MKNTCLAFLFLLNACFTKSSRICVTNISELLKSNPDQVFISDSLSSDGSEIRDKDFKSNMSGVYTFYSNGNLKSYRFFANQNAYTYDEEYDINGNLIKVEGNPLVNTKIKEVNRDSITFNCYFFAMNKIYQNLEILINSNNRQMVELMPDTLYSNMKSVHWGFNTKESSKILVCISYNLRNSCTGKTEMLHDTISLVKTEKDVISNDSLN